MTHNTYINTYIIAEAACTHDGRFASARKLCEVAADAGADAVKFQWTLSAHQLALRRNVPDETYRALQWPIEWITHLSSSCRSHGIDFILSIFHPNDVSAVAHYVDRFKVASLDAGADDLRDALLTPVDPAWRKPIIVSLGAMSDAERTKNIWMVARQSQSHEVATLLCVCAYPAPLGQLGLNRLTATTPSQYDGYSDHSGHLLAGALAVALGAKIVEVHFRLHLTDPHNADYHHSHSPSDLDQYIRSIRLAERMINADGYDRKGYMQCEEQTRIHRVLGA